MNGCSMPRSDDEAAQSHLCHYRCCALAYPSPMAGSAGKWALVPVELRDRVWQQFSPGMHDQSDTFNEAATEVRRWVDDHANQA